MLSLILALAACGSSIGTPCRQTQGAFGLSDPCASECLDLWTMTCPDGRAIQPAICAGGHPCTPGSCPSGQLCYAYPDPFDDDSYCVPDDVCGPLDAAAGAAWETSSAALAEAERAAHRRPPSRVPTATE